MYALSYSDGGRKTEQLRMTFGAGAVTRGADRPRQDA